MKTLATYPKATLKDRFVILRTDWNVPIERINSEELRITDATRLITSLPTLSYLTNAGAKVIILSHFQRPQEATALYNTEQDSAGLQFVAEDDFSFKPLLEEICTITKQKIHFLQNPLDESGQNLLQRMDPGDVVLCDNMRFFAGEDYNDPILAKALASLGSLYVNDAFSCSHRAHASTEGIAHHVMSVAGFGLCKELNYLIQTLTQPRRPLWAIIGGSKISSKIPILKSLIRKVDGLIIGGAMAHTFLKAQGFKIGKSLIEDEHIQTAKEILQTAHCEIVLPIDARVAQNVRAIYHDVDYADIEDDVCAYDIGPKTIENIKTVLSSARTILWNGPLGVFEHDSFAYGSRSVAEIIANLTVMNGVLSIAGGGDTLAAIAKANVQDKLSFISTAGGAFLEWIEDKTLPGIQVLEDSIL